MEYTIKPLNENQGMNCDVRFSGNRVTALAKASCIAADLQNALPGATITCRVRQADETGPSWIVTPDGKIWDEKTGNAVRL
jgi:hypothetical protein